MLPGVRAECGSTLVEFALVIMVFMTMMLGIIEFSRALYTYHFLSNMARDATRWAAVNGSTCGDDNSCNGTGGMNNGYASAADIAAYVASRATMGIDANKITTAVTWPAQGTTMPTYCAADPTSPGCNANCHSATIGSDNTDANSPGCTVEVKVSYPFYFLFPFIHKGPITLSSTSEMVIVH